MIETEGGSIFELSGVGIPTICQWCLVRIVSLYEESYVTAKEVASCIRDLMKEVTYKRDESFLFWLGPAVTIEEILDEKVCLEILEVQQSIKRYKITKNGEEALKPWIPRITKTLSFESDEEFDNLVARRITRQKD